MVDQNLCPGLIFQTFCIHPSYLLPHLCGRYFIYSLPHPVKGRTEGSLASSPQIIRPATVQQDPQLLYLRKVPIQLHILDLRSNNYFCTYGSMELHDTQHMDPSWSNFINFLTCLNLSPGRLGAYTPSEPCLRLCIIAIHFIQSSLRTHMLGIKFVSHQSSIPAGYIIEIAKRQQL